MTEILLEVGEPKVRQFETKRPLAAVAELVWNALDANAIHVRLELNRTTMGAVEAITIADDGNGITPDQARESFREFGDTWKSGRTHTIGDLRILHGENGEGRLYALALGEHLTWDSVALVNGVATRTVIECDRATPTRWEISDPEVAERDPGTIFTATVPQGKRLRALEADDAAHNLAARFAFYLLAYTEVQIEYDRKLLIPEELIERVDELALDLPSDYSFEGTLPVVRFVEWKSRTTDQKLLLCNAEGLALAEYGNKWSDAVVSFTPYLVWEAFNHRSMAEMHYLVMEHSAILLATEQAIRQHLAKRHAEISGAIIDKLKDEGIYPYDLTDSSPVKMVERQTFDLVVTVARDALPPKGAPRKLSVGLIQAALEHDPSDLHDILEDALSLDDNEKQRLSRLLDKTSLANVISAASTVVDRLSFIGGIRKILSDAVLRVELREVDQLHPMVAQNLWLFGEEWNLARTEVGLTSALAEHLRLLGDDIVLEANLDPVIRSDGRKGRVDILLYRNIGDERTNDRLIVELKRPSVKVGRTELEQIKSYARAIVESPNFRQTESRWQFVLVTWDYHDEIKRDIQQKDKPLGLADDQPEYQVWVRSWGEVFDLSERKLHFFRKQLDYEATDDRVTAFLQQTYREFLPDSLQAVPSQTRGHNAAENTSQSQHSG
jgi:hypothetical protein